MADPASTSPAYSSLVGTKYERYVTYLQQARSGRTVNPRTVSNLVENIKQNIRNLGSMSYLGGEKGALIERQQQELRLVRNELIQIRNQSGGSVSQGLPASQPGSEFYVQPVPLEQQQIRTPFGSFRPGETPYEQVERGTGSIGRSAKSRMAGLERTPAPEPEMTEIRLTSQPLASPIERAESFVMGINVQFEGRQVLIGKRQGNTYSVEYNPALSKSGYVDELAAQRLTEMGFQEVGGKFVYVEPSYEIIYPEPEFGKAEFDFDFTQPMQSDLQERAPPTTEFPKETDRRELLDVLLEAQGKEKGAIAAEDPITGTIYAVGGYEEKFFSSKANPLREFFAEDYSGKAEKAVRSLEDETGLYLNTPIGELRISQGVGFVGEGIEDYLIKPIVATPVVLGGTLRVATETDEEKRLIAAGTVFQAYPSFIRLPYAVATIVSVGGAPLKSTVQSGSPAVSREISSKVVISEGEPLLVREFQRGGFSYTMERFLSPSQAGAESIKSVVMNLARGGGKLASPAVQVVGQGVKFGVASAGAQAGVEFGVGAFQGEYLGAGIERLKEPATQERIKAAGIGGFLLGGSVKAAQLGGPAAGKFISSKTQPYLELGKGVGNLVKTAPGRAVEGAAEFGSAMVFLAGSEKGVLGNLSKEAPWERPISFRAAAKLTEAGLNPVEPFKARVRQREVEPLPKQSAFPVETRVQRTIRTNLQREFRQRFIGTGGFETPRERATPREGAFIGEQPGARSQFRMAIRQEAIERDIIMERGRLKVEQVAMIRQRGRESFQTGLKLREGLLVVPRLGEFESPLETARQGQRFQFELPQQPREIPTLSLPKMGLDSDDGRGRKGRRAKPARKGYSPSIYGVEFNLTTSKVPKGIIGLGARPLVRRRRK